MSPALLETYDFITAFKPNLYSFDDKMTFTPKYKFKNLKNKMPESFLRANCYSHGSFCATDNENFEPQSVLMEGIRQICIWNISKVIGGKNNELWWSYIFHYRNCLRRKMHSKISSQQHCYDIIREELDLPESTHNEIIRCVKASFSDESKPYDSTNRVLESNINSQEYNDVYLVPAMFVNNNLVKEDLKPKVVVSAICNILRTKPDICYTYLTENINWNYGRRISEEGHFTTFGLIFVIILVAAAVIFYYFKRNASLIIREEINNQVKTHVTEYMRLSDKK